MSLTRTRPLVVLARADRSDAAETTLSLLRWARRTLGETPRTVVLSSGPIQADLRRVGARVVGEPISPLATAERSLRWMGISRPARALRLSQLGSALWRPTAPPVAYCATVQAAQPLMRLVPASTRVVVHAFEEPSRLHEILAEPRSVRLRVGVQRWLAASDSRAAALVDAGIDAQTVTVCEPFIDPPVASPDAVEGLRSRLGSAPGDLWVGATGPVGWPGGADVFIRVAEVLRRRWPDRPLRFVWLGAPDAGPSRWVLEHDIEHAGLASSFTLAPEGTDTAAWLTVLRVLCLTGRAEPPVTTAMEGASLGVPVVGFARPTTVGVAEPARRHVTMRTVPYLDVEMMADEVAAVLELDGTGWARRDHVGAPVRLPPDVDERASELWSLIGGAEVRLS